MGVNKYTSDPRNYNTVEGKKEGTDKFSAKAPSSGLPKKLVTGSL